MVRTASQWPSDLQRGKFSKKYELIFKLTGHLSFYLTVIITQNLLSIILGFQITSIDFANKVRVSSLWETRVLCNTYNRTLRYENLIMYTD